VKRKSMSLPAIELDVSYLIRRDQDGPSYIDERMNLLKAIGGFQLVIIVE
jgi:hypothetical protein